MTVSYEKLWTLMRENKLKKYELAKAAQISSYAMTNICRSFYKSSEYNTCHYKYAYLRDVPKNKKVTYEKE